MYLCSCSFQAMMLIFALIGPGTIFLMLVGAMALTLNIEMWGAVVLNIIPLLIFIILCYVGKTQTQVNIRLLFSFNNYT